MEVSSLPSRAALLMSIVVKSIPLPGLLRLLEVSNKGGIIGHRYTTCFFGTVALACGAISLEDDDLTIQKKLFEFCSEVLGIDLIFNKLNAIESLCQGINAWKTRHNSLELALIANIVDEELDRRTAEQLATETVTITRLAGDELPLYDSHERFVTHRRTLITN